MVLTAFFPAGELVSLSGKLYNTRAFGPRKPAGDAIPPEISILGDAFELERAFDPELGEFVAIYYVNTAKWPERVSVAEQGGPVLKRKSAVYEQAFDFMTNLKVYPYPSTSELHPPSNLKGRR